MTKPLEDRVVAKIVIAPHLAGISGLATTAFEAMTTFRAMDDIVITHTKPPPPSLTIHNHKDLHVHTQIGLGTDCLGDLEFTIIHKIFSKR